MYPSLATMCAAKAGTGYLTWLSQHNGQMIGFDDYLRMTGLLPNTAAEQPAAKKPSLPEGWRPIPGPNPIAAMMPHEED